MQGVSARADDWLTIDTFAIRIADVVRGTICKGDQSNLRDGLSEMKAQFQATHTAGYKVILIGNGGSSAIASHLAIDLCKNGQIRSVTFNDFPAITCLANDFSYDQVFVKQLEYHARENDCVVCISSSGKSMNIRNAAHYAKELGCRVYTFTGMIEGNALSNMGHVNFWVPSKDYGIVEIAHMTLIHSLVHCCI
jgi:D-sedoheptulose 7-phosphate isomerase